MTQTLDEAVAVFRDDVTTDLRRLHDRLIKQGRARWQADPDYAGVYGLLMGEAALVVVYADGDWAMSDRFEDLLDD